MLPHCAVTCVGGQIIIATYQTCLCLRGEAPGLPALIKGCLPIALDTRTLAPERALSASPPPDLAYSSMASR